MSPLTLGKRPLPKGKDQRPFRVVPGEGPMPAQIMLIGERPGENEARAGRPFIGMSGQWLSHFLRRAGLEREQIYITNLVKEFADWDKPTQEEISKWEPELWKEIAMVDPKVIGLLGTYAVEALTGRERAQLERTHGVPMDSGFGPLLLPMFHPASGFYNQSHLALCQADFEELGRVAQGEIIYGRDDEWKGRENYHRPYTSEPIRLDCAIDTEGSKRHPWCATVSTGYGLATIYFPDDSLVVQSNRVLLHNSLHDLGVLRSLGVHLGENQFVDTMVWAYLLCLEPQGLKPLAWRHCGMEMDSYDEIIGEADRNKALEYLMGVDANEWSPAQAYVAIEGGRAKIKKPNSINQRVRRILADVGADKRNSKGDPVDPRKRWNDIDDYLKQEVVAELGPMPEATLDDVPREKAVRYACRDADATFRLGPKLEEKIIRLGLQGVSAIDHAIIPMVDRMQHVGIRLAGDEFWQGLEAECNAIMEKKVHEIFKCTGWQINPDSWKQCGELLFKHLGLTATKFTDSGEASTKDKALESIYREHPVVDLVLDYREASKVKSSFVNTFRRIIGRGQDRVHPNLRITRVSSGRLAAAEPNLMAIPVRSNLGKKVREGFIAGPGRMLLDMDLDQIEMRWMADASRDAALVKLFIEGTRDVHTQTAAQMFGIDYRDVQTYQRYAAKRVGFGVITGITEYGLVDQMALARATKPGDQPWTIDDCAQMIQAYFGIYAGVKCFMEAAGDEAEQTGMVTDHWGRIRYLPGASSPIEAVRAESRRQASSHKIQAGAQGLMKQAMKATWDLICGLNNKGWDELWPIEPLLQIHDSQLLDIDEGYGWVAPMIRDCMTQTVKAPNTGLPFKAKGGMGKTWATIQ